MSGKPITEDTTVEKQKEYQSAGTKRKMVQSMESNKGKNTCAKQMKAYNEQGKRKQVKKNESNKSNLHNIPQSGPSGLKIIPVSEDFDSDSSVDKTEETVTYCQYKRFEPEELKCHVSLIFVKWVVFWWL